MGPEPGHDAFVSLGLRGPDTQPSEKPLDLKTGVIHAAARCDAPKCVALGGSFVFPQQAAGFVRLLVEFTRDSCIVD
jgi:hypothetical protein